MSPTSNRSRAGHTTRLFRPLAVLMVLTATVLTGCSMQDQGSSPEEDLGYTPRTREVEEARQDARTVSSQLVDAVGLNGKVSDVGPGVSACDGMDRDTYFTIRHPWSVTGAPPAEMEKAMGRLRDDLPGKGWKVVSYGRDKSKARSLELIADYRHGDKQFSVNIKFYDERGSGTTGGKKSKIMASLVSACFQVPEGKSVDTY